MKELSILPPRQPPYERNIYLFLSLFRFFSLALAFALLFTLPKHLPTDLKTLLTISLIGAYTILKILYRFRLWQRDLITYAILGGDLAVCLALVLLTRGADSPFLLYSLLPTITAALFFEPKVTLTIATLTALNLLLAHTALTKISPDFAPILEANYLTIVIIYGIFCFLIATITYQSNLSFYHHLQSDAITEERRRLRQELHDGIAQVLGFLRTKTNLIKSSLPSSEEKLLAELDEVHQAVSESYQDIREAIDFLNTEPESDSLTIALSHRTEQLGKRTGNQTEFSSPPDLPTLHPAARLHLLRIAEEALNNIRKHASATQVWVRLEKTPQGIALLVKDNGRGFSPAEQKGTGLKIMEERAESIGAILKVTSSPGQGTEIKVSLPRR